MRSHRHPIIALLILAPMIGELLSGSAPPAEYFNPFSLLLLTALYGSGALVIRETVRRWKKGWASILLLGLAYGIYEEGIVVRSFFDPSWGDLGLLAEYGRFIGVNWVWSLQLSIYHAVVSISVPIMLVELLYPAHRKEPWLQRKGIVIHSMLFLTVMVFGPLVGMQASFLALLGSVIVIGFLIILAYLWPTQARDEDRPLRPVPGGCFTVIGFGGTFIWFLMFYALPELNVPALINLCLGAAIPLFLAALIWLLGKRGWRSAQQWGISAGILSVFILLAFIAESSNATRPDNTSGMAIVGFSFFVFLIWLRYRIHRQPLPNAAITE